MSTENKPVAWASATIDQWPGRQSEKVVKLTREAQPEHGFDIPLVVAHLAPAEPSDEELDREVRDISAGINAPPPESPIVPDPYHACACGRQWQWSDAAGWASAPAAPTPPAPPEGWVMVRTDVVEFLCGDKPIDGVWFGEKHPGKRGMYWWRSEYLRPALAAPTPPQQGE